MKDEKGKVFQTDGDFFKMMEKIEEEAIKEAEAETNQEK